MYYLVFTDLDPVEVHLIVTHEAQFTYNASGSFLHIGYNVHFDSVKLGYAL